jgi:hypothetical protein
MWVVPSDYTSAEPDPLRNFAENIVEEFNNKNAEDVRRIYNIYVESDLQVLISLISLLLYFLQDTYCESSLLLIFIDVLYLMVKQ